MGKKTKRALKSYFVGRGYDETEQVNTTESAHGTSSTGTQLSTKGLPLRARSGKNGEEGKRRDAQERNER